MVNLNHRRTITREVQMENNYTKSIYFKTTDENHTKLDNLAFQTKTSKKQILNTLLEAHFKEMSKKGYPLDYGRRWHVNLTNR